jgi:uncharacterized protein with beta-barrel porin domain
MRLSAAAIGLLLFGCATDRSWAQTPTQELDRNWVNVCPGAIPGTPYYERCQEIINAGPGSGNRKSAAATGNNLESVSAQAHIGGIEPERKVAISEGRFNFFAAGNATSQARRPSPQEHGFDVALQSLSVGADYLASPAIVTGLALSYETSGMDFERGVADLEIRRYALLNFWNYAPRDWVAVGSYVGYDLLRQDATRTIDYLVTLNAGQPDEETRQVRGIARAKVRGHQLRGGGDLEFGLARGAIRVAPHVALDYVERSLDPYTESDDVGLAMAYDRQVARCLLGTAGVSASLALSRGWGVLTPHVRADYLHQYAVRDRSISARFAQDANQFRFPIRTDGPDEDWFVIGGGLVAVLPGGFSAFLSLDGSVGNARSRDQAFASGLRARW